MTELLEAIEKAAPMLLEALDKARAKGEEKEEFFMKVVEAYVALMSSFHLMRAYGKIGPARYESITQPLLKEAERK